MISGVALEFHDSEVAEVGLCGRDVVVRFSAGYVHRTGTGEGAGFLQSLELVCLDVDDWSQESGCVGRLSEGTLQIDGERLAMVPVPWEAHAPTMLSLTFANGAACEVRSRGMRLQPVGEARFVEWLRC
mgnify:CR=1 FL=1